MSKKASRTWNPDVPPEAVITWLCKERDEARDKFEKLVGYTKGLEIRIQEMEQDAEVKLKEYAESIDKALKLSGNKPQPQEPETKRKKRLRSAFHRIQEEIRQLAEMEGVEL